MSELANLFLPGPTWVRREIREEMARPMIGHRSNEFREMFARINANLKPLFKTSQDTFIFTCGGTGVMQASLENCVARRVLVTTCGGFGERWFQIAQSLGYEVDRLDVPWGEAIDPEHLADHLRSRRSDYDAVTLTHNETSTGVTNDIQALARVLHEESPDALVLVDAVSSLAGIDLRFDDWQLDVCFAGVQKCLALPPGISVAAVSARAIERAKKHPYRGTYFDFLKYKEKAKDNYASSTPSVPHFFALDRQLRDIVQGEGFERRIARHRQMRDITIERTSRFSKLVANREHASTTVTALAPVKSPDGVRNEMMKRGFTVGGGYGQWKANTLRIGHMGDITVQALNAMLDALEAIAHA